MRLPATIEVAGQVWHVRAAEGARTVVGECGESKVYAVSLDQLRAYLAQSRDARKAARR